MMNESEATVIRVDGDQMEVEALRQSGCGRCNEKGGCGGVLAQRTCRAQIYRLPNTIGARVGDRVILAVQPGVLLNSALAGYLLPALLALLGAGIGNALLPGTLVQAVGALMGLGTGFFIFHLRGVRAGKSAEPLIASKLKSTTSVLEEKQA
jgi:sigma-E factor negative regulatory protein RseC